MVTVTLLAMLVSALVQPYSPYVAPHGIRVTGGHRRIHVRAMDMAMASSRGSNENVKSENDEFDIGASAQQGGFRRDAFRRVLLAATATPFLTHGAELPLPTRRLVSDRARTIFSFCASYLADRNETRGWDVDIYASGGYVRDLLLGRVSSDLDLSLCLARCPSNVTVAAIAGGMDEYCRQHPDLGINCIDVVSCLSDGAERKAVDAAQICIAMDGDDRNNIYVDLLPTIGAEEYDEIDRIPRRDQRGSAEEDSLRRDLTIGAMLLQVSRRPNSSGIGKLRGPSDLRFVLHDFHGGIEDVCTRTLRCPVPHNVSLREVYGLVAKTKEDEILASSLGLDPTRSSYPDDTIIETLWWAKIMIDDPYRILRTLRFSATLDFRIAPSFWLAARFALRPGSLDAKVSSTRKIDELRKVAQTGGGAQKLLKFFRTILDSPIGGAAFRNSFFAAPLGSVGVMDYGRAQRLVAQLPPNLSVDETIGAVLAAALLSCINGDGSDSVYVAHRLISTSILVDQVCEGLQIPTEIRRAARDSLSIASYLLEPLPVLEMHSKFAKVIAWPPPPEPVSMEERAQQFAYMVRLWSLLHFDPWSARRSLSSDPRWVMAMLAAASRSSSSTDQSLVALKMVRELEANADILLSCDGKGRFVGPSPRGGAFLGRSVANLPEVPPHLRGQIIAAVHVLSRLRGDAPIIETPDDLRTYLESNCDGLLTKLSDEWWDKGIEGKIRSPYIKK